MAKKAKKAKKAAKKAPAKKAKKAKKAKAKKSRGEFHGNGSGGAIRSSLILMRSLFS